MEEAEAREPASEAHEQDQEVVTEPEADNALSLSREALILELNARNLSTTGSRATLASRLSAARRPTSATRDQPARRSTRASAQQDNGGTTSTAAGIDAPFTPAQEQRLQSILTQALAPLAASIQGTRTPPVVQPPTGPPPTTQPPPVVDLDRLLPETLDRTVPPPSASTATTAFNVLPVPSSLVERAIAGKFVDLSDFLPDCWHQVEGSEVRLQLQDGGVLAVGPSSSKRREIQNIFQWTEAFSAYASVLSHQRPARGPELFAYQATILRAAREFTGSRWRDYDQAFRKLAAANHAANRPTDWSQLDLQLYNRIFVGHARPQVEIFSRDGPAAKRSRPNLAGPQQWPTSAGNASDAATHTFVGHARPQVESDFFPVTYIRWTCRKKIEAKPGRSAAMANIRRQRK